MFILTPVGRLLERPHWTLHMVSRAFPSEWVRLGTWQNPDPKLLRSIMVMLTCRVMGAVPVISIGPPFVIMSVGCIIISLLREVFLPTAM